jgi:protein subunit release factor A
MEAIIIEIRAAEGGTDAKLLVTTQFSAYVNAATKHRL